MLLDELPHHLAIFRRGVEHQRLQMSNVDSAIEEQIQRGARDRRVAKAAETADDPLLLALNLRRTDGVDELVVKRAIAVPCRGVEQRLHAVRIERAAVLQPLLSKLHGA